MMWFSRYLPADTVNTEFKYGIFIEQYYIPIYIDTFVGGFINESPINEILYLRDLGDIEDALR